MLTNVQTISQLINGDLKGATSVKISQNLEYFPDELFDLVDTLEYLDLSGNKLRDLPHDFDRFKQLKVFFASDNLFTVYPSVLGRCNELDIVGFKSNIITHVPDEGLNGNLRWLILTNNQLQALPETIGKCSRMQKLMLAGNQLKSLPVTLSACRNLSLLRLSANQLTELPQWLLRLPNLSWLAFSGNDIKQEFVFPDIPEIDFNQCNLKELLGEGASGTIYKAERFLANETSDVAIKIFKGNVTSDGYPEDEMKAYMASGSHPSLVKLLGKIDFHKEQKSGLVMELIPNDFSNLGKPPSLESCTRDIFDTVTKISVKQVLCIAASIASVGLHLHSRGLIHGDLYAHNILINDDGETLFGDFGAASFYDVSKEHTAFFIERIEVKAYGYLLDDLISICNDITHQSLVKLKELRERCLALEHNIRPSFKEIVETLAQF